MSAPSGSGLILSRWQSTGLSDAELRVVWAAKGLRSSATASHVPGLLSVRTEPSAA